MAETKHKRLIEILGLTGSEKGNVPIRCPIHADTNESASVNFEKGLFNCFAGCGGMTLDVLADTLFDMGIEGPEDREAVVVAPVVEVSEDVLMQDARDHLEARGFTHEDGLINGVHPYTVRGGHIWMAGGAVGRNLYGEPKYHNEHGSRSLVWIRESNDPEEALFLVEGIFDGIALADITDAPICTSLGAQLSKAQAYELMGRTAFILYDADHAGFEGSRAAADRMREYGAHPIILHFPKEVGHDINQAFVDNREGLGTWFAEAMAEYGSDDSTFVARMFSGGYEFPTLRTGIDTLDTYLNGGYGPGAHTIGGGSGEGKTSLARFLGLAWAYEGKRVLDCSYEVSREQLWARNASRYCDIPWAEIEKDPTIVPADVRAGMEELAENMKVTVGWNVDQIEYAARQFDVIIVDYLQRMPGPYGGSERATMANVAHNITRLSDIGLSGKVVIVISELSRAGQQGAITKASFKESGAIEYRSQSLLSIKRVPGTERILCNLLKNTRGREGGFQLHCDLAHQTFTEFSAGHSEGSFDAVAKVV